MLKPTQRYVTTQQFRADQIAVVELNKGKFRENVNQGDMLLYLNF